MTSQCTGCQRFIQGTPADPVITAKSLGWKTYHDACAQLEWARLAKSTNGRTVLGAPVSTGEKMPEKKTQFRVQCIMIEHGEPTNRWHFTESTLEGAEHTCEVQMAPSLDGERGECNVTSAKYVNCTISLLMKTGKQTVIDERLHPLGVVSRDDVDD